MTVEKNKTGLLAGACIIFIVMLSSFKTNFGGEGFEVFLNNKPVVQQFGNNMNVVKTLKLDQVTENDVLSVAYHHCGRVGKNRTLTLKDAKDKIVKQWSFKDVNEAGARMNCKIKDILDLKKGNMVLKLYYSSSELPTGRQIAALSLPAGNLASR